MNSNQLTAEQWAAIEKNIVWARHYLDCLTGRMHQKHFPQNDELKVLAEEARAAIARLSAHVTAKCTASKAHLIPRTFYVSSHVPHSRRLSDSAFVRSVAQFPQTSTS